MGEQEAFLKCQCMTFNVATNPPPPLEDTEKWDGVKAMLSLDKKPDIIVINLQEVHSRLDKMFLDMLVRGADEWTQSLSLFLSPLGYKRIRSVRVLGCVLDVFILERHLPHLREIETSYTRLSVGGYVGLKAASVLRMRLYGVSMCFVGCHLSAHDYNLERRIAEYESVVENIHLKFDPKTTNILYHDYVFWMGDMNFRLAEGSFHADEIANNATKGSLKDMLEADQLSMTRKEKRALHELQEMEISFPPTYKLRQGADRSGGKTDYNLKRRPAWTDRILFRCNEFNYDSFGLALSPSDYGSHADALDCSDHAPVTARFEANCFSPEAASERSLPAYNPIITFRTPTDWQVGHDFSIAYTVEVGSTAYLDPWDWIGVYDADFRSLEDYVSFTWASLCRLTAQEKEALIMDNAIVRGGRYRLIYFGVKNCVLGISQPFDVTYPDDYPGGIPVDMGQDALQLAR